MSLKSFAEICLEANMGFKFINMLREIVDLDGQTSLAKSVKQMQAKELKTPVEKFFSKLQRIKFEIFSILTYRFKVNFITLFFSYHFLFLWIKN